MILYLYFIHIYYIFSTEYSSITFDREVNNFGNWKLQNLGIALNLCTYFSCSDAKVLKFQKSYKYLGKPMWFLSHT